MSKKRTKETRLKPHEKEMIRLAAKFLPRFYWERKPDTGPSNRKDDEKEQTR